MTMTRRTFLKSAAIGVAAISTPSIIKATGSSDQINVGYLHTLAVDGHIWTADLKGYWKDQGLKPQFTRFYSGLEIFQAMVGGSIDMLSTGAVISNFPARGQGKVFLINNVEFATAQLWINPKMGVNNFADLRGKKIATTIGTTAHVFLDKALRSNRLNPGKDVSLINQRMPDAVTAFISGAVPAVALWVPFNIQLQRSVSHAKMLVDASAYYPEAAITGGWAASNSFYKNRKDVLERVIKAWLPANQDLTENANSTLKLLQNKKYPEVPLADMKVQYKAQKLFTASEWKQKYQDGTVNEWLDRVTDFYVNIGGIRSPIRANTYFVPSLFLKAVG